MRNTVMALRRAAYALCLLAGITILAAGCGGRHNVDDEPEADPNAPTPLTVDGLTTVQGTPCRFASAWKTASASIFEASYAPDARYVRRTVAASHGTVDGSCPPTR